MNKNIKILMIVIPLILILVLAVEFQAQQECREYTINFVENFDNVQFKDEENSSVLHWGEGYITLRKAGILQNFPVPANFPTWISMVAYADFDGDGLMDMIGTSDTYSRRIAFIKNMGNGTFQEKTPYIRNESSQTKLVALVAGDFDSDGWPDFMYTRSSGSASDRVGNIEEVAFYKHKGTFDTNGVPQFTKYDYTSKLASSLQLGWASNNTVTIDIDKDGDLDILYGNGFGQVILLRNDGTRPLSNTNKFAVEVKVNTRNGESGHRWDERGVSAIGLGDFDKDGDADLIVGSVNWRGLKYYKNDGNGNFTLYKQLGDINGSHDLNDNLYDGAATAIAVADYDGDGSLDFVVGTDNWNPQEVWPPQYQTGSSGSFRCGGQRIDYNTGTKMGGKVFYFRNDGHGEFTSKLLYNGPQLIFQGQCGAFDFDFGLPLDYDGDGDPDFMMADGNHSAFYYCFDNVLSDRYNLIGIGQSTDITSGLLDRTRYSITKVQFAGLSQSVIGNSSGLAVTYYVSNNGGASWELYAQFSGSQIRNYTNLAEHTFTSFGTDLRWKAVLEATDDYPKESDEYHGTSNDTPRIDRIEIKYTYVDRREYSRTSAVSAQIKIGTESNERKLIIAASFIFPGWEGHLRAYDVTGMTAQNNSTTVLRTISTSDLSSTTGRQIVAEGANILWDAAELLNSRSAGSRNIYTAVPAGSGLQRIDFSTTNVATLGTILGDQNNDNEGLIDFIRAGGRYWKLGDINHSNPILVAPPDGESNVMGSDYAEFKKTYEERPKVIVVGANDGLLHCFDVATGQELWAYVPYNLLPKLKNMRLVDPTTGQRYFNRDVYVDGSPTSADVYFGGDWHTILICGQGPGKGSSIGGGLNYYFALDITDVTSPQPLWEFTDQGLGETWSVPAIGRVKKQNKDTWVAFVGSGYDNDPDNVVGNKFYAIDIETGQSFWSFTAPNVNTSASYPDIQNTIPGSPSIVDMNKNGYADRVYVGDLDGRIWKIDVSPEWKNKNSWTAEIIYEDSNHYPILSKPAIWMNYSSPGAVACLYFGTGGDDRAPSNATYSFIALQDNNKAAQADRVEWFMGNATTLNLPIQKDVGDLSPGEKVWADPQVANYIVYFNTFAGSIESVNPCENLAGLGQLYGRFVQKVGGSIMGGTAFKTAGGNVESLTLFSKTRSAVTLGEKTKTEGGQSKREVYIQEYDSTLERLEQPVGGTLIKVKSWREVYQVIR